MLDLLLLGLNGDFVLLLDLLLLGFNRGFVLLLDLFFLGFFIGKSDILLYQLRGRYLYLGFELVGRGGGSISRIRVQRGSDTFYSAFPEVYHENDSFFHRLISVYSIGWMVTEEMTSEYPQIVPAFGETDTGTVICFDCEDGNVSETIVIPAGMKALSINPLNWKTDGTPADKSLNHGAVFEAGGEPVPELCGAYIGERGELIVTDAAADYPPGLDVFPEGAYHLYDYMFFFTNLKENVAMRTAVWSAQHNLYEAAA